MKLKKLTIDSYRHLENLRFDFSYPEGHPNAGQQLDKICIIGQSATGKTSILELIKDNILELLRVEIINSKYLFHHYQLNFKGEIEYLYNDGILKIFQNKIIKDGKEFENMPGSGGGTVGQLFEDGLKFLYLSSEIISKNSIDIFNKNPHDILAELSTNKDSNFKERYINVQNYGYEFIEGIDSQIWFSLLYKILEYRKRFTQMASQLIHKGAIGDISKLSNEYLKWSKENENPVILFANFFNPILEKLNLEVDLINTEFPIPIKSKLNDEVIPVGSLSTGTKGMLLSMFPLYALDTTDSIILLDEPERSLFPDMQIDLISYYQKIAPNAQLIVATHSPFIAAAFEPEERFILYFNEKGIVTLRRGDSPIGDDPNDILRNDFNVDYYNEFGKNAYKKYLELKRKLIQEKEPKKKEELILELSELGDKYKF